MTTEPNLRTPRLARPFFGSGTQAASMAGMISIAVLASTGCEPQPVAPAEAPVSQETPPAPAERPARPAPTLAAEPKAELSEKEQAWVDEWVSKASKDKSEAVRAFNEFQIRYGLLDITTVAGPSAAQSAGKATCDILRSNVNAKAEECDKLRSSYNKCVREAGSSSEAETACDFEQRSLLSCSLIHNELRDDYEALCRGKHPLHH